MTPRGIGIVIGGVLLLGGLAGAAAKSSAFMSHARASFHPGERGLNELRVEAPWGTSCIVYSVTAEAPALGGKLEITGKSRSKAGLFAPCSELTNYYPANGPTVDVPLETHVRLATQFSPAGATALPDAGQKDKVGTWLLVTRDPTKYDRLESEAPALR